jgi:hypothetical protein
MRPKYVGRKLGIGMRVATRILRDRAAQSAQNLKQEAPVYAEHGRAVARGSRKFGEAVWGPFVHAGGVLWLEVTGLFFGLFSLYFSVGAYEKRHSYRAGPEHQLFWLFLALAAIFIYFTVSSFHRALRKDRKKNR